MTRIHFKRIHCYRPAHFTIVSFIVADFVVTFVCVVPKREPESSLLSSSSPPSLSPIPHRPFRSDTRASKSLRLLICNIHIQTRLTRLTYVSFLCAHQNEMKRNREEMKRYYKPRGYDTTMLCTSHTSSRVILKRYASHFCVSLSRGILYARAPCRRQQRRRQRRRRSSCFVLPRLSVLCIHTKFPIRFQIDNVQ